MTWIVQNLWLVPALPTVAAGISALLPRRNRVPAAALAIGSMSVSFVLSVIAFAHVLSLSRQGLVTRQVVDFRWFQFGNEWLKLGWMLDPLTAIMLVMVTFVGLLIFIYSVGYMEHDENFTRFFCFLALFAGAMLGVVIANSLLLLFMCWETGRPHFLPADRLLVSQAGGGGSGEKSLHRHPHWRPWILHWHGVALRADRYACSSTMAAPVASNILRSPRS